MEEPNGDDGHPVVMQVLKPVSIKEFSVENATSEEREE
jgi:hypothetical protein